ncbi:hypothetical protein BC332_11422 [Capsicum chinense]|nr:hypothetical protein BC332_11422 [Capsicum chinense]
MASTTPFSSLKQWVTWILPSLLVLDLHSSNCSKNKEEDVVPQEKTAKLHILQFSPCTSLIRGVKVVMEIPSAFLFSTMSCQDKVGGSGFDRGQNVRGETEIVQSCDEECSGVLSRKKNVQDDVIQNIQGSPELFFSSLVAEPKLAGRVLFGLVVEDLGEGSHFRSQRVSLIPKVQGPWVERMGDCPSVACSDQPRVEDVIFLTLRSVQTLSDPKVVDGIKMELFEVTAITRKIILEGESNDAPLTVFETTNHYDYDHNGCTDFSPDFAISSECSSCKCQDCKAKHDGVINAINALTASVKKMTFKRGVIPSKRISYPDTLLEIKAAKRRMKDTSKASSIIKKSKIATPLSLSCTDVQCTRTAEEQHRLNIPAGLPWHLVDEVYIPINCGDEFHLVLAVVVLKERHIRVYDSMSRRRCSGPSSEIQKLTKILPTYLDISGFLDQKVRTDWSTIEAYRDKMANPFDVQYVDRIAQQIIGSLDCGPFVAAYAKYLSDGLEVLNDGLDAGLLHKRHAALLWKYGEVKAQKPNATDVKDPRRPKPNSIALDEEQLVHIY